MDDLIKLHFTPGLQRSGGEALCNGSEDSRRPHSVPAVEVDDMLPASGDASGAVTALLQFIENSFGSRVDAIGLDNLHASCSIYALLVYMEEEPGHHHLRSQFSLAATPSFRFKQ